MALSEMSDNARIDYYFDVHGGITYAGGHSEYPIESNLWWFGFDCAHAGDGKDLKQALEYGLIDNKRYEDLSSFDRRFPMYETTRTLEYCEDECKSLARQLSAIIKE